MAYFNRMILAPEASGSYRAFRSYVRADFRHCCAFCLMHEFWSGGQRNYELDHFRPVSLFPHLERDYYNLYYACRTCNLTKLAQWPSLEVAAVGIGFVDFCRDDFDAHYRVLEDGALEPLTDSARFTLINLRLNSDHLVEMRFFLLQRNLRFDAAP